MFLFRQPVQGLILHLLFCLVHGQNMLCPYEECECDYGVICNQLTSMPTLRTGHNVQPVTILELIDTQIQEIPENSLPSDLTSLIIERTPIWHIDPAAFNGSTSTLTYLAISNAEFTELPDALLMLDNLETLILGNTPFQNWNFTILSHLGRKLVSLTLYQVDLKQWPEGMKILSKLMFLTIQESLIANIPDDAFSKMNGTLVALTLINSNVSEIPKCLVELRLWELDLTGNGIEYLENLPEVTSLNLSHNLLSEADNVVQGLHMSQSYLSTLIVSYNQITAIPKLSHFSILKYLYLDHNNIESDFDKSTYSMLGSLSRSLHHLDLSSNQISTLVKNIFPENSSLQYLYLKANPIRFIASTAFENVKELLLLDVSETLLTSFPLILFSLKDLAGLRIIDMPDLNCTCPISQEFRQLGDHFLKRLNIKGDCANNQLTLGDFYLKVLMGVECRVDHTKNYNTGTNLLCDRRLIILYILFHMTLLYSI